MLPSRTPRQPPSFLTGSQPGGRVSPPRVCLGRSLALLLNVPPKPSSSLFWTLPTWNCHPYILQHCTSPHQPPAGTHSSSQKANVFQGKLISRPGMVLDRVKLVGKSEGRNPLSPKPKSISTWHLATESDSGRSMCVQ